MNPWEDALNEIVAKSKRRIGIAEPEVRVVSKNALGDMPEIRKQLEKLLPQRR